MGSAQAKAELETYESKLKEQEAKLERLKAELDKAETKQKDALAGGRLDYIKRADENVQGVAAEIESARKLKIQLEGIVEGLRAQARTFYISPLN